MPIRFLAKTTFLAICAMGLAVAFPLIILNFVVKKTLSSTPLVVSIKTAAFQGQVKQASTSYGLPKHVKIPKINVDAAVEQVGLTPDGDVDIPKIPANAAWFNRGVRPGQNGSAVIVGHFGLTNNKPAVFDNLHKLQTGDSIFVEDENGAVRTFVVREFQTFDPDELAPSVFKASTSKAHLNLITCQGAWNKSQDSYSKRLVVFADKY